MSKCISNTIIITGTIHKKMYIYTYNVDGLPHDYKTIQIKNDTY